MSVKVKDLLERDLYNLILYAIYKSTGNPKYSTLAELIYTVDKLSLLKLCGTFGGCTIQIPTIDQLETYTKALMLYDLVCKGSTVACAIKLLGIDKLHKQEILDGYNTILLIVSNYEL